MMNTSKITGGLLALALGLPAQESPETVLQRAKTLHELEHDAAGAAELYRRVAADASVDAAVRSQAWLDLAEVERSLGKVDAAKAALTKAAEGEGEAAAEATRRLQDPAATRSDVELQILKAIQNLRAGMLDGAAEELVFYGERALPLLFRSIENETGDLNFIGRGATVVWRVGGESARAWLASEVPRLDALRRRAVVHGIPASSLSYAKPAAGMEASFATFFTDPDPGVRLEVCERFHCFPISPEFESFVDLLLDADVRVASAAAQRLVASNSSFWGEGPSSSKVRAVSRLLEARTAATVPAELLGRVAQTVSNLQGMWATSETRALLIRMVEGFPEVKMPPVPDQPELRQLAGFEPFAPDELAPEILSLVRSLGERPLEDQRTFDDANQIVGLLADLYEHWTHDSMPVALELARRGLGGMSGWLNRHAEASDWLAIAKEPYAFSPELVSLAVVRVGAETLGAADLRALQDWFDVLARGESPRTGEVLLRRVPNPLSANSRTAPPEFLEPRSALDLAFSLAATSGERSARWAERYVRSGARGFLGFSRNDIDQQVAWEFFAGLTRHEDADRLAAVRRIALDPELVDDALRNHAVGWLIHQGAGEPIELILAARGLGLAGLAAGADHGVVGRRMPEMRANVSGHPIGVEWLFVDGLAGYGEERLDEVVRAFLRAADAVAWATDLDKGRAVWSPTSRVRIMELAEFCPLEDGMERFVENLYEAISPREDGAERIDVPSGRLLASFIGTLAAERPFVLDGELRNLCASIEERGPMPAELRAKVVELLHSEDSRVRRMAIEIVGRERETLRELFDDVSYPSRSAVLDKLFWLEPVERRVELLLEGLPDPELREEALSNATSVLDERLVEPLLACLRDGSNNIRERAQSALDIQRAWFEEEARWARLRSTARLDATSAAAALLTQAAADQPKPIRLAAIRSLGTLALPETLPLLIEMLRDQDAGITAAASAAIERINREQDD